MQIKIDPRSPGQSSDNDCFKDPHGHGVGSPSDGGHVGMGRDDSGGFSKAWSQGGKSPDGDAMVAKYKPGGGGEAKTVDSGSELNDEGDGWA